ncbi:MAG: phosphoglycerate kinase [Sphingobacteriales bacterium]|jgi:phosphoglycerate kinase
MITIDNFNFSGKKVLVRVDFNVPLNEKFEITDDKRIQAALPTLNKLLNDGASIILMSHLGRPKDGPETKFSLKQIVSHLSNCLGTNVGFADDCMGDNAASMASALSPGQVLLLENLRFYSQETKGGDAFVARLASYGNFYVNDAFGTAHRAHASTALIADHFNGAKCFGYLMASELNNAQMVMEATQRPITAVMGGAKVSDKIQIIKNLMDKVDNIIIGGGMAYTFAKAQGGSIGNSLVENDKLELAKELISLAKIKGVNLALPVDSLVADAFSNEANTAQANNDSIQDGWMGLDIGPESIKSFKSIIAESKIILWNGPMGVFEMSKFEKGTKSVGEAIVEATKNGAYSLIGGGDSAAAVAKFNMQNDVSYVSTGGGALLEYLEGKVLPGVAAIMK